MRAKHVVLQVVLTVLAFVGTFISYHLTEMHLSKAPRPKWFESVCSPTGSEIFNCTEALKTKWAVFRPSAMSFSEPDEDGRQPGIPVAMLGWFYFTAVTFWFLLIGRCDPPLRALHIVFLAFVLVGCAISGFFIWVLLTKMKVKCLWCISAHAINFVLLVGALLLTPRRESEALAPATPGAPANPAMAATGVEAALHPGARLVIATFLCIAIAIFAEIFFAGWQTFSASSAAYEARAKEYKADIDRMLEDTETQWSMFQAQTPAKLNIRPDDPHRGELKGAIPMVVFSDFECPFCRKFAEKIESDLRPFFDGHIVVYWKHLPLCHECNPKANVHPYACKAAYAAEAARLQGGNDAFWKAHDALYAHQRELGQMDYRKFAADLGLDAERFIADMNSDAVKNRVKEDVELANKLGITRTPSGFLWERPVSSYLFDNKAFLSMARKVANQAAGRPNPPDGSPAPSASASPAPAPSPSAAPRHNHSEMPARKATPGSPAPRDGD